MKTYDFSNGKRGAQLPLPSGKERVTMRLDREILDWFRDQVEQAGGGDYHSMINDVLRAHVQGESRVLEDTLRRVVREELQATRR